MKRLKLTILAKFPKIHSSLRPDPFARICIYSPAEDPYRYFVREAFEHLGLFCEFVEPGFEVKLKEIDALVLCGRGEIGVEAREALGQWVGRGGLLICVGQTFGLEALLGVVPFESQPPARGKLSPVAQGNDFWPEEAAPARFFGGTHAVSKSADVLIQAEGEFVGLTRQQVIKGLAFFFAPDLGQTLTQMQMGTSVEIDGIGPNDGSAILSDGVLRSEDGSILSYEQDRTKLDEAIHPFFGDPHADTVKEILMRVILMGTQRLGKIAVWKWFWQKGAQGQAILAVDCTDFDPEQLYKRKQIMDVSHVPAVWMVAQPGYGPDTYRMIRRWDDEIGLLFTPPSGPWSSEHMRSQYLSVHRTSGVADLLCSRPRDGRWKGHRDFYDLAEKAGSRVCLGKGGVQAGTQGFLFGTCHPFFAPRSSGETGLCLEIPWAITRPGELCVTPVMHALFRQAALRYGCCVATIPVNFDRDIGLKQVFLLAQQYQMNWTLPSKVYQYEKLRRQVTYHRKNKLVAEISSDQVVKDLCILVTGIGRELEVDGRAVSSTPATRFGVECTQFNLSLGQRGRVQLTLASAEHDEEAA